MRFPHLAARIFNVPLLIDASKAATILGAIGHRISPDGVTLVNFDAGIIGDALGQRLEKRGDGDQLVPQVSTGIGLIAVEGTLVHKGKWVGMDSGETSYEGIQAQVRRAMRDDRIKAVIFEVDSFGGEVSGAFETAAMIAELSRAKPTLAILTDHALSAGYLLASGARKIIAPSTGYAGSIGVVTMHVDESKALEAEGIKVTMLYSGKHKADGNPFEALPETVAEKIKADADRIRDQFAAFVGAQRGGRITKAKALATEAQYFNADEALALGLIDGIGRPHEAASMFARAVA